MKSELIGAPKVVMSNPMGIHNYFGWPSVARLQGGQIAVAASGYRLSHVCPFGKAVVAFSEDEGETYTNAWPVIDTVLDDRDAGIVPAAGGNQVIFTSFNNTTEFQRSHCFQSSYDMTAEAAARRAYCLAYLDQVSDEEQNKVLGSTYRISNDGGITYGPLMLSPITSPHGPEALKDGGITWETDHVIWENPLTPDLGYPATVELKDGSLLTVFYAHEKEGEPAVIMQQRWKLQ